jgi:hypothetical protein
MYSCQIHSNSDLGWSPWLIKKKHIVDCPLFLFKKFDKGYFELGRVQRSTIDHHGGMVESNMMVNSNSATRVQKQTTHIASRRNAQNEVI